MQLWSSSKTIASTSHPYVGSDKSRAVEQNDPKRTSLLFGSAARRGEITPGQAFKGGWIHMSNSDMGNTRLEREIAGLDDIDRNQGGREAEEGIQIDRSYMV